ncbi:MAG: hypothetical protein V4628_13700 [Pseudomonadota bacterium]
MSWSRCNAAQYELGHEALQAMFAEIVFHDAQIDTTISPVM